MQRASPGAAGGASGARAVRCPRPLRAAFRAAGVRVHCPYPAGRARPRVRPAVAAPARRRPPEAVAGPSPAEEAPATQCELAERELEAEHELAVEHELEIDVRYYETDAQGVVHHANYFCYFELARVEMLKAMGHDYADLERDGYLLVVHKIECRYLAPARFGDRLKVVTRVTRATPARIEHAYRVLSGERLLAEASSTIACIDRQGNVSRMPDFLVKS